MTGVNDGPAGNTRYFGLRRPVSNPPTTMSSPSSPNPSGTTGGASSGSASSVSPSKAQLCAQQRARAEEIVDRTGEVLEVVAREVTSPTITAGELEDERLRLRDLAEEVNAIAITALPPTLRTRWSEALRARTVALGVMEDMIAARMSHVQAGGAGAAGGPPTTTAGGSAPAVPFTSGGGASGATTTPMTSAPTTGSSSLGSTTQASGSTAATSVGASTSSVWVQRTLSAAANSGMSAQGTTAGSVGGAGPSPAGVVVSGGSGAPSTVSSILGPSVGGGGGGGFSPLGGGAAASLPPSAGSCDVTDAYYLSFPVPWNVYPQKTGASTNELIRIAMNALPKFDGDKANYLEWRGGFIPCVHVSPINLQYKIMLLRNSMKPDTMELRELMRAFIYSPEGYRQTIVELEEMYGGEETRMLVRQEAILSLPGLKEGDYRNLLAMKTRLGTYLLEWQTLGGGNIESLNLFAAIMGKMDRVYGLRYCQWVEEGARRKGLQSLLLWLKEQVSHHRAMEQYALQKTSKGAPPPDSVNKWKTSRPIYSGRPGGSRPAQNVLMGETEAEAGVALGPQPPKEGRGRAKEECSLCGVSHLLVKCPKFKAFTPQQRKSFLAEERRCFRCFQKTHLANKCPLAVKCRICEGKHHSMLHMEPTNDHSLKVEVEEQVDAEGALSEAEYGLLTATGGRVSLRTLVVWAENPATGKGQYVNALLDDGCTSSMLVAADLASDLQLEGDPVVARTEGVGGHLSEYKTIIAPLSIRPRTGGTAFLAPAQVMNLPAGQYRPVDWHLYKDRFDHLRELPLTPPRRGGIQLLVGNRHPELTLALREVVGSPGEPVARLTPLGWTVVGPVGRVGVDAEEVALLLESGLEVSPLPQEGPAESVWRAHFSTEERRRRRALPSDRSLVKLVRKMLEVEQPLETKVLSPHEEYAVRQLRASLTLTEGRYQAACLWKPGAGRPGLPQAVALRRLKSLERGPHFKEPQVSLAYARVFSEWEKEGFIRIVREGTSEVRNYIPHFPIVKDSASTPVRPVMDCAVTLNDYILAGPNLLNDVATVLLRFRSGLVSFSGDVKQMFLRIRMRPEDRPFHCFLWRASPRDPLLTYQFQVHVFGNAGSPCVAVFVVKEHAKKYAKLYPSAVDSIHHSTLIDDVLDSSDTVEAAARILSQSRLIFSQAGMKMTKFYSSHLEVLEAVPREDWAKGLLDVAEACHKDAGEPPIKALGMQYDPRGDEFVFSPPLVEVQEWTKRKMLKTFPQVWDPLGLALPYVMNARMCFSKVAREVRDWDVVIEPSKRWLDWLKELPRLRELRFPRCLKREVVGRFVLHVFADASQNAYAAVAYLLSETEGGCCTIRLVSAKAHVAPPKAITIPRMELLAMYLAAQLKVDTLKRLKVNVGETHLWTDSTTVLYWLHNDRTRFQQFVYNKLEKIRELVPLNCCHWLPTHLNPADLPSRGVSLRRLLDSPLWWEGPDFLRRGDWPDQPKISPTSAVLLELRKEEQIFVSAAPFEAEAVLPFERWGTWERALRVVAKIASWRLRAQPAVVADGPPAGRQLAEKWILKQMQLPMRKLWEESPSKAARKKAGWLSFPVFIDEEGLMRGKSRLAASELLSRDAREPILLDRRHSATRLLIEDLHEKQLHYGGVSHVLGQVNARFWLPGARTLLRQILNDCVRCRRRRARVSQPPEGPLSDLRLPPKEGGFPFAVTAVDCAGPFRVKVRRSHQPYYLALFTCCQLRAVRLEWMSSLSTDAFLLALTRVASGGVNPHTVISDNGGNFVGANVLLQQWQQINPVETLAAKRPAIRWKFNPPYAAHRGGVFERLIKATKEALYQALPSERALSLEQLSTAFYVVEGVLNRRPLSYSSSELADLQPLTPNHFLHGAASTPLWDLLTTGECLGTKQLKAMQQVVAQFYERFHREIVPYLACTRRALDGSTRNVQVGDVVSFFLPTSTEKWPLGRVKEVYPGRDGAVRTVLVERGRVDWNGTSADKPTFKRDVRHVSVILPSEGPSHSL